ncbi:MAG TPA: TetR-like C-terminal domain-containing protein [Streptosporangiaceae bacterium]|nr:TetR-like C-terminal domain-containing protein [Streptosporangiaceae bacterium]
MARLQIVQWATVASDSPARFPGRPRDAALDVAILSAAARHLGERGFAGMSMEGVAAAAGTTAPSLRRRFRGKLELAVAGIDAMPAEPLPGATGQPRADALAILENLRANLVRRNGMAIFGTVLAEERRNPELLDHFRQRLEEPRRERLRQALARGAETGHLPVGLDLDAAVSLLIGSLYACYLRTRCIPGDWAERTLGMIWPMGQVMIG